MLLRLAGIALSLVLLTCVDPEQASAAELGSSQATSDVAFYLVGSGVRTEGWATVPVVVHLVPTRAGSVWYRWGAAPGLWQAASGPIAAPEGKQTLSAILVEPDGDVSAPVVETVRSDYQRPVSALSFAVADIETTAPSASSGDVTVSLTVLPAGATEVQRLDGHDRYDVGAKVAKGFTDADTVIIASGEKFPDALTASGLAGCLEAPLLLTRRMEIPVAVTQEISRLGASKAIVCGGPVSVDAAVVRQLTGMGLSVERISGADRFAVAANTAARIRSLTGRAGRALVARGDIYPDALSLGPIAYANREPILLVLPNSLPPATRAALASGYSSAAIAGGTASVSPSVASQIASIVGPTVRWGGADRYQAAVNIASAAVSGGKNSWKYVAVAKGTDFADALTGGTGAGHKGGVLLLTAPAPLSEPAKKALEAQTGSISKVDVLGGVVSITPYTYETIHGLFR